MNIYPELVFIHVLGGLSVFVALAIVAIAVVS
jgi:hypothetical protein